MFVGKDKINYSDNKSSIPNDSGDDEEYPVYKKRWWVLMMFAIAAMTNQVAWISLQPVAQQVSDAYGESGTVVNTISLVYQGLFIVFTFPSNYIIDVHGCRKGVVLGAFMTALGMVIKCFIN